MALVQVLLVDLAVEEATEERVDRLPQVKETLDPLAYPTAILTGLVVAAVVRAALVRQRAQQKRDLAELVLKFPGFQQLLDRHSV